MCNAHTASISHGRRWKLMGIWRTISIWGCSVILILSCEKPEREEAARTLRETSPDVLLWFYRCFGLTPGETLSCPFWSYFMVCVGGTLNWHLYNVVCASKGREHGEPVGQSHAMAMMVGAEKERETHTQTEIKRGDKERRGRDNDNGERDTDRHTHRGWGWGGNSH